MKPFIRQKTSQVVIRPLEYRDLEAIEKLCRETPEPQNGHQGHRHPRPLDRASVLANFGMCGNQRGRDHATTQEQSVFTCSTAAHFTLECRVLHCSRDAGGWVLCGVLRHRA